MVMFHPWSHYNSAYQPDCSANLQMIHGMAPGRDSDFGFAWSRTQILIKPAFACTIDKAQGATMNRLGLLLDDQSTPCFSHGQLYVHSHLSHWRPHWTGSPAAAR